jgi:sugar phosphate isomerase/epimerase
MYASMNRTLVAGKEVRWQQLCALAQQFGFPGVDVDLAAAMRDGVEATKDLLAGRSLRPAVVGCPVNFRRTEEEFQEGMKQLPAAAAFAAAIGCPRMTVWVSSSTNRPREEMWRLLVTRFSAIAKVLADHNIRFGLEYLGPLHIRQANPYEFAYRMASCSTPGIGIMRATPSTTS